MSRGKTVSESIRLRNKHHAVSQRQNLNGVSLTYIVELFFYYLNANNITKDDDTSLCHHPLLRLISVNKLKFLD
jgi:hypothetical protein